MSTFVHKCFLLTLIAIGNVAYGDDPLPETDKDLNLAFITAKIESPQYPSLYGTAILLDASDDHYIYVANAHVLPNQFDLNQKIILRPPLEGFRKVDAEIIGIYPGYDLAFLRVENISRRFDPDRIKQQIFLSHYSFDDPPLTDREIAIWGIPGQKDFSHELRFAVNPHIFGRPPSNSPSFSSPVNIAVPGYCPPLFLTECYAIPILSWGFSGGVLISRPPIEGAMKAIGMVSHYEPGSPVTYIIPMHVILRVYEHFKSQVCDRVCAEDLSGKLKLADKDGLAVIFDEQLESLKHVLPSVPLGGGGVTSGGGGVTSGGGGDRRDDYVAAPLGASAFLGDYNDVLNALSKPAHWGKSGDQISMIFGKFAIMLGLGEQLSFWQHRESAVPEGVCKGTRNLSECTQMHLKGNHRRQSVLPELRGSYSLDSRFSPGMLNLAQVRRFKKSGEVERLLKAGIAVDDDTRFAGQSALLKPLIDKFVLGRRDLVVNNWEGNAVVNDLTLHIGVQGLQELTLRTHANTVRVSPKESATARAENYQHGWGQFECSTADNGENLTAGSVCYCRYSVEMSNLVDNPEFRLICGMKFDEIRNDRSYLTQDRIYFYSIYGNIR